MASNRERKWFWLSLASLPVLLVVAFRINAWRNIEEYSRLSESEILTGNGNLDYAGALWRLENVRLIGDGRDTAQKFPGAMRLIVVRLVATAHDDIGKNWGQCQVSLTDDTGRRWLPLEVSLSNDISRDLEPKADPVNGCGITSLTPPKKSSAVMIEEKFVVPADAAPKLAAQLSFSASRPKAISLPLGL
ncbi:hypothetical protein GAO09_28300 [Rhizobiales bacterium RZME27]|uniref:Uncharacterized protein n=1 Tax=Endobacterium cereale TaxID=2663029 RepID=A0A6A8AGH8_9HYPH|nr:hypothetical protein [Endobacterium cereale]MEB2844671.1 hypothetical protein [Endobacterium cereale]MQY49934.1 hypothetical protein [Endobacterium cereale]